jgi:hypothetical protein
MSIRDMFGNIADGCAHWRNTADYNHECGAPRKAKPFKPFWMEEKMDLAPPPEGWTPRDGMKNVTAKEEVIFFSLSADPRNIFYVGSKEDFDYCMERGRVPVRVEPGNMPTDWRLVIL